MNTSYYFLVLFIVSNISSERTSHEEYTTEEMEALKKFQDAAKHLLKADYERSNMYMIHWLRARNLHVEGARDMLAKNKAWRKEKGIDKIVEDKNIVQLMKNYPAEYGKAIAKDGKPCFQFSSSNWDLRKSALHGHKWENIPSYFLERMNHLITITNQSQWLQLSDMSQFNARRHACLACLPFFIETVTIYETYFPNHIKEIIIFNAPSVFVPTANLIKSLLTPLTSKAIQFFGYDRAEWQAEILRHIDADQLTRAFGGTKAQH